MLSAPATIPATSALTLTGALHPPGLARDTCSPTRSDSPARSARAITGTSPTADTKLGSGTHFVVLMLRVLPVGLASSG